jgi:hypothetical protein
MRFALPLITAIVLLVGCGGAENDPNLAAAAAKTEGTGSSAVALKVTQSQAGELEKIDCAGEADYAAKRMRLSCGEFGEFIAVGSAYYASGGDSILLGLAPDKRWVRVPVEEDESSPHDFAPGPLLAKLRAASLDTARLGEEDVRGETTVRYRMTVNCEEAELGCPGETTAVEVWIDDDGLVRRASFEDDGADITAEFFDFGIAVEVQEPAARDIVDLDNPSLRKCSGGGRPISDVVLRRAMREQGFELSGEDNEQCFLGVVAFVAGFLETPSAQADAEIAICYVYGSAASAPHRVEETSSRGVIRLRLHNVACSTFDRADGPASSRLRATLKSLE